VKSASEYAALSRRAHSKRPVSRPCSSPTSPQAAVREGSIERAGPCGHPLPSLAKILQPVLDFLKSEHLVEIKGGTGVNNATYLHVLSSKGAERAREAMAKSGYVGPAP